MNLDSPAGRAVIEAIADALCCWHASPEAKAEDGLTAALAVRVPCETCGGVGWVPAAPGSSYITTATGDPCDECSGSGSVSALRLLMEDENA